MIREGFRTAPDIRFTIHAGELVNQANNDREWSEWFGVGGFIHAVVPIVSTKRRSDGCDEYFAAIHNAGPSQPFITRSIRAVHNVQDGLNTLDQQSGTVYVVSVSGGKMYKAAPDGWTPYKAVLERKAENTQLFQIIRVAGDTLRYCAHTATGALSDAFELQKESVSRRNRFLETMPSIAPR